MHELLKDLLAGDRRALARSITLVESSNPEHRRSAHRLLDELPPPTPTGIRLGISGTPGVGKSSFVNEIGCLCIDAGRRPAVLAVDPSSVATRGSILGDKTRMAELAQRPEAFIRPSPSAGVLGGVARATRQAIRLCEAAGYDIVLVETVGIGQSEVSVEAMVDLFVLLIAPGGGDDVQGIKRGVMELVDIVVVNKDDGDQRSLAATTAGDYASALHLFRRKHAELSPSVLTCSTLERRGLQEFWEHTCGVADTLRASGALAHRRSEQRRSALWAELTHQLMDRLAQNETALTTALDNATGQGGRDPSSAAAELLDSLLPSSALPRTRR